MVISDLECFNEQQSHSQDNCHEDVHIQSLGLPSSISLAYKRLGINYLYCWQSECLKCITSENGNVRHDRNLVYSAPTSGGKTLVAELLLLSHLGCTLRLPTSITCKYLPISYNHSPRRKRIALFIAPYISIVIEKQNYFQHLCRDTGLRFQGFHHGASITVDDAITQLESWLGEQSNFPPPFDVALCTLEKANKIINGLCCVGLLSAAVGVIVVDEVHIVEDPLKGELLTVMLSKVLLHNDWLLESSKQQQQLQRPLRCSQLQLQEMVGNSRKEPNSNQGGSISASPVVSVENSLNADKVILVPQVIQIIAMSATLPNLPSIAEWLNAAQYETNYRPIDLKQMVFCNNRLLLFQPQRSQNKFSPHPSSHDVNDIKGLQTPINQRFGSGKNSSNAYWRVVSPVPWLFQNYENAQSEKFQESSNTQYDRNTFIPIIIDSLNKGLNTLVFCSTKKGTEFTAKQIAKTCKKHRSLIELEFDRNKLSDCLMTLAVCEGNDTSAIESMNGMNSLAITLAYLVKEGVAFHHSGLTMEERSLIENGFRKGIISTLCATSTVAAGVNLPAHRVVFSSPYIAKDLIDHTRYRQMCGRAGRKGLASVGESIMICRSNELNFVLRLIDGNKTPLADNPLESSQAFFLNSLGSQPFNMQLCSYKEHLLQRLILEVVAADDICRQKESRFSNCVQNISKSSFGGRSMVLQFTRYLMFLSTTSSIYDPSHENDKSLDVNQACQRLVEMGQLAFNEELQSYQATLQGKAVAMSGLSPVEGFTIYKEVDNISERLILEGGLQLAYICCPLSSPIRLDWNVLDKTIRQLQPHERYSVELLGINPEVIHEAVTTNRLPKEIAFDTLKLSKYYRLYTALLCVSLVRALPIELIMRKFNVTRGDLQALQTSVTSFGSMTVTLCEKLSWWSLSTLLKSFLPLLRCGTSREYCSLMEVKGMTQGIAKAFHRGGIKSVRILSQTHVAHIEKLLLKSGVLAARKGNLAKLVAMETKQNAKDHLKEKNRKLNDQIELLRCLRSKIGSANGVRDGSTRYLSAEPPMHQDSAQWAKVGNTTKSVGSKISELTAAHLERDTQKYFNVLDESHTMSDVQSSCSSDNATLTISLPQCKTYDAGGASQFYLKRGSQHSWIIPGTDDHIDDPIYEHGLKSVAKGTNIEPCSDLDSNSMNSDTDEDNEIEWDEIMSWDSWEDNLDEWCEDVDHNLGEDSGKEFHQLSKKQAENCSREGQNYRSTTSNPLLRFKQQDVITTWDPDCSNARNLSLMNDEVPSECEANSLTKSIQLDIDKRIENCLEKASADNYVTIHNTRTGALPFNSSANKRSSSVHLPGVINEEHTNFFENIIFDPFTLSKSNHIQYKFTQRSAVKDAVGLPKIQSTGTHTFLLPFERISYPVCVALNVSCDKNKFCKSLEARRQPISHFESVFSTNAILAIHLVQIDSNLQPYMTNADEPQYNEINYSGLLFATPEAQTFFLPFSCSEIPYCIGKTNKHLPLVVVNWLLTPNHLCISNDMKRFFRFLLDEFGLQSVCLHFDPLIAHWVMNPNQSLHHTYVVGSLSLMKALAFCYGIKIRKQSSFFTSSDHKDITSTILRRLSKELWELFCISSVLSHCLITHQLLISYYSIEMPIAECLAWMEHYGTPLQLKSKSMESYKNKNFLAMDKRDTSFFNDCMTHSELLDLSNLLILRLVSLDEIIIKNKEFHENNLTNDDQEKLEIFFAEYRKLTNIFQVIQLILKMSSSSPSSQSSNMTAAQLLESKNGNDLELCHYNKAHPITQYPAIASINASITFRGKYGRRCHECTKQALKQTVQSTKNSKILNTLSEGKEMFTFNQPDGDHLVFDLDDTPRFVNNDQNLLSERELADRTTHEHYSVKREVEIVNFPQFQPQLLSKDMTKSSPALYLSQYRNILDDSKALKSVNFRVHPSFHQTFCFTGWIKSSSPNISHIAKNVAIQSPIMYSLMTLLLNQHQFGRTAQLLSTFMKAQGNETSLDEGAPSVCVAVTKLNFHRKKTSRWFRIGKLQRIVTDRNILHPFDTISKKMVTLLDDATCPNVRSTVTLLEYWMSRGFVAHYESKTPNELSAILQVEVLFNVDLCEEKQPRKLKMCKSAKTIGNIILNYPLDQVWVIGTPEIQLFLPTAQSIDDQSEIRSSSLIPVCLSRVVTADDEWSLLTVKYLQLGFRLIAHFSNDSGLIRAFSNATDPFTHIASDWFEIPAARVTSEQRSIVKEILSGIQRGRSEQRLSREMNIPEPKVQVLLKSFLEKYKGLAQWMNHSSIEAQRIGSIQSLYGRRPLICGLSTTYGVLPQVQSSASELVKKAMVRIFHQLVRTLTGWKHNKEGCLPPARPIFQVHSELVFEIRNDVFETFRSVRTIQNG